MKVLIIDDDTALCRLLYQVAQGADHQADYGTTLKEGLRKADRDNIDLVFLDVALPDADGLSSIPEIKKTPGAPEVIIITGAGSPKGAELAIENGAWGYVEKPFSTKTITLELLKVQQYRNEKLQTKTPVFLDRDGIIGESEAMVSCLKMVASAAKNDANVFISGETGTGKELIARAIHNNSKRGKSEFVVVDCSSLTETVLESTLFGHIKGAFTGAVKDKQGLVLKAHGGTLFLDELGELPLTAQSSFLRVLQDHIVRPVGATKGQYSNFRLIAATNRNLDQMTKEGQFREDLLYRVKTFPIDIPPLRNRKSDIKEIVIHTVNSYCERYNHAIKGFSSDFFDVLRNYEWPGNVRELINAIERAVAISGNEATLFPVHLPVVIRTFLAQSKLRKFNGALSECNVPSQDSLQLPSLEEATIRMEEQYFKQLVTVTDYNIKKACDVSGLSRSKLYQRLKKYGIRRE